MLVNKKQYLNTLKLRQEFNMALVLRQNNPDSNHFKQQLYLNSIQSQLELFEIEIKDYEQRNTRSTL